MTNIKKASIASIVVLLLLIGIAIASFAVNSGTITKEAKLRKTASNNSIVLEIIPNKEDVEILAKEGDWYQVRYNKIKGYVQKDFIKVNENASQTANNSTNINNENVDSTSNVVQTQIKKGAVITTTNATNLYIRPLINSKVIANVEKGKSIAIIEIMNEWAYVNIDMTNGWIRMDALGNTNNSNATVNEQTSNNEQAQENNKNNEQAQGNNTNTEENKVSNSKETLNKTAYITSSGINFREKPNTDSKVIKVFALNAKVTILEEQGEWYKVKNNDQVGYVIKTYVSEKKAKETISRGGINRTSREETQVSNNKVDNKETSAKEEVKTQAKPASGKGQEVANYVKQFVGHKYIYGGASPKGFDCSGLTMYAYKNFGVNLSHSATAQSKTGQKVSRANLQPGDLVFFTNYRTNKGIGHVGIYIGNNKFVHASTEKTGVITSSISGDYARRYVTATRIF